MSLVTSESYQRAGHIALFPSRRNLGCLTLGFAEADPRQLAPTVRKTCALESRIGDSNLHRQSTIHRLRKDPIQVGFIAISASSTTTSRSTSSSRRKQENFRARHSKIDINKSAHAQPTRQKNVCVAGTCDDDSEHISTIPSVERCEIKISKIYENFSKFQRLDLRRRLPH